MKKLNPQIKGTYFLCLFLSKSKQILIGKLGAINFKKGYYLYVGKAFGNGGIITRLKRHLNKITPIRWHIDYLKINTEFKYAGIIENIDIECELSKILNRKFPSIKNFGSSDCKCSSHLFYSERDIFIEEIKKAGINPRILFNIN